MINYATGYVWVMKANYKNFVRTRRAPAPAAGEIPAALVGELFTGSSRGALKVPVFYWPGGDWPLKIFLSIQESWKYPVIFVSPWHTASHYLS